MSYGYEYGGFGGGFNPMEGYGDGGGGFGFGDMGGGFMGGAEEQKKSGEKKTRDRQNFMPVTLKQLSNSRGGDDVYRVDDVEIHTVKLIGTATQFNDDATNYSFKLSDGTGEIDCKKWKDTDAPSSFRIDEGATVRVVGTIREFAGRSHLLVYSVTPIKNWNEVTHHILDVIFTHLQNTKGKIPTVGGGVPSAAAAGMHNFGTPARGQGMAINNAVKKENKLEEDVYNAYRASGSRQEGLHFSEVQRILRGNGVNISQDQLARVVEQLCNDGRLYTTIDEEHFRPTVDEY